MMLEKPKRADWKTLALMLPLVLVFALALLLAPGEYKQEPFNQVSTSPAVTLPAVTEEAGEDVAKFGSSETNAGALGYHAAQGQLWPFKTGVTVEGYTLATLQYPDAWPANIGWDMPPRSVAAEGLLQAFCTYDKDTLEAESITAWFVNYSADPRYGKAALYSSADALLTESAAVEIAGSSYERRVLTLAPGTVLVEGQSYIIAVMCGPDHLDSEMGMDQGLGNVLPLIKGPSDGAEGNLLR